MIDSPGFLRLRRIGLTPAVVQQLTTMAPSSTDFGADQALLRVTEVQREGLTLHDGEQEQTGRMLPALRAMLAAQGDAIAVGDWVRATRNAFGEWWAAERVPPVNQLARRLHDGRDKVERVVIVANVDTALLVMGLDHDFNPRRLERYVALVAMAGIQAVVVLTKKDLCTDPAERLRLAQAVLPPGVPAVALDALGGEPRSELAPWLQEGQTLVLMGSSGAGKSTLTNALVGAEVALVGAHRADDSRGRHTTTARSLHQSSAGACIIDTPGLRTLRLDGEAAELAVVFGDIASLALQCRFRDCRHQAEPGCAVRDGVAAERLRNYQKLQREARRDTLTALERKTQVSQWKARSRAAKTRMDAKRG